jgi:hypothetical protein
MTNKRFWFGILVMALVCAAAGFGYDNGAIEDTWTNITSLTQLNGIWKGSFTRTQTESFFTMKIVADITMTITAADGSTGTASSVLVMNMTFPGNSDLFWPMIKEMYSGEPGFILNESNHSITMTENIPPDSISLSEMTDVQINQNGTKFRKPATGDEPEMIFTKQ